MYEKHFHLACPPFNLSPDPRFLYVTESVREALATLAYGVSSRRGFVLLTGDVGTGKTTMLNVFMQWLAKNDASTAYVFNPRMDPREFLDFILADFGVSCDSTMKSQRLLALNTWLINLHATGRPAVLIVDEAQQLSGEMLEELRLLTNLETPTQKLLQIILSGQNELDVMLNRPSLRQLRQRITLRCRTLPLSALQTKEYIVKRLETAGGSGEIFPNDVVELIHQHSSGTVRIVNLICEQALICAFCDGEKSVSLKHVNYAVQELALSKPDPSAVDLAKEFARITASGQTKLDGSMLKGARK